MTDTTIDTNALIERLQKLSEPPCANGVKLSYPAGINLLRDSVEALRTITAERDEQNRLYKQALLNVQTSVAHAENLNAQLENYQEKARALHKYLGDKNVDGIKAVITEFSLMAEQEVSE